MDLLKIHDGKLKIALTAEELHAHGLTISSFDYENVKTKRALWQMLDEAKKTVGFDASNASLYVELYPSRTGGCEIFVTRRLKKEKSEERKREQLFVFPDSEPLIALSAALSVAGYREASPLYAYDGRLYLVIVTEMCAALGASDLALEFASPSDGVTLEELERRGQLLTDRAVERLSNMILHL